MKQEKSAERMSIVLCTTLQEMNECVELERVIWNDSDADLTPALMLIVTSKTGGLVLLARDGERPVGFAVALPAFHGEKRFLHSHIAGVLPEYQSHGLGGALKWKQRELALADGITHMEWTFDPLAFGNARFNVIRLGAIMRRYCPNLYGITHSPLHNGLPTDRFIAEWHMDSSRVERARAGEPMVPAADAKRVVVPVEMEEWKKSDTAKALDEQARIRSEFQEHFAKGLAVTGFRMENGNGVYLLEAVN